MSHQDDTREYTVEGMTCGHCALSVHEEVAEVAGRRARRRRPRLRAADGDRRARRRRRGARRRRRGRLRGARHERRPRRSRASPPCSPSLFGVERPRRRRARPRGRRRAPPATRTRARPTMAGTRRDPVRGLAVAEDGLRLVVADPELRRGRTRDAALPRSSTSDGAHACATSTSTHEKRMHLIVVRRDLTGFQHLHPEQAADGTWTHAAAPRRRRLLPRVRRLRARRRGAHARHRPARRRRAPTCAPLPAPAPTAAATAATTCGSTPAHARPGDEADLRFTITRDGAPVAAPSPTSARAATWSRCARATSRSCTSTRRARRATASAFAADVPDRGPLPPVPAVQARRPRPHRRLHAARSDDARPTAAPRAADHGHDVRVVREPHRAQAQQARRRHAPRSTTRPRRRRVDFDAGAVEPERARRRGRGRRLPRRAARRPSRRRRREVDETAPLRRRLLVSAALTLPVLLLAMIPPLQFDNWQWLSLTLAAPVVVWGALAVPPRGLGEPQARHGDDGHADLASACSPRSAGRCTRCSSATPAMPGMTMALRPDPRARRRRPTRSTSRSRAP